jgi:hypothetical protein
MWLPFRSGDVLCASSSLVAVWHTKKTRHLVQNDAEPQPRDEDHENQPKRKKNGIRRDPEPRSNAAAEWPEDEKEGQGQEPQQTEQADGEAFAVIPPVHQLKGHKRKNENRTDDRRKFERGTEAFHGIFIHSAVEQEGLQRRPGVEREFFDSTDHRVELI